MLQLKLTGYGRDNCGMTSNFSKKINSMFIVECQIRAWASSAFEFGLWVSNAVNRPAARERVVEYRAIASVFIGRRNSWEARSLVRDQWSTSMIDDPQLRVFKLDTRHALKARIAPVWVTCLGDTATSSLPMQHNWRKITGSHSVITRELQAPK